MVTIDVLKSYFTDRGWVPYTIQEYFLLLYYQSQKNPSSRWHCIAQINPDQNVLIFYSVLSPRCPPHRRREVFEYLMLANAKLSIGNFEIDPEDDEISFKSSMVFSTKHIMPDAVFVEQFSTIISANLLTTDRYLPGLVKVIYTSANPVDEIKIAEAE